MDLADAAMLEQKRVRSNSADRVSIYTGGEQGKGIRIGGGLGSIKDGIMFFVGM